MERFEALSAIIGARSANDAYLFVCNGILSREVFDQGDDERIFYLHGGMGLCAALAAGFARQVKEPVIALEGDGNLLMGLPAILIPRELGLGGFVHIVLDNGAYETTGGQQRPARWLDFAALATLAGYDRTHTIGVGKELADVLAQDVAAGARSFVRCLVNQAPTRAGRPAATCEVFAQRIRRPIVNINP